MSLNQAKDANNAPRFAGSSGLDGTSHKPSGVGLKVPVESATQALALIGKLKGQGRSSACLELAEYSVRRWPDHVPLLLAVANIAKGIGRNLVALELLTRAVSLGSDQAVRDKQALIDVAAPYWHFRMMNDEVRNTAYDNAIKHYVTPESLVLDIGCGAGLLSMMAARAGAAHVYACEMHELMHHKATQIIKRNGFADRITAYHRNSVQLKIGEHLPRKADIIIAEVFDSGLLGEDALSTFAHAREHLLAPGGRILPGKASVQAQLVESDLMHKETISQQCAGFDVSELNSLSPSYFQIRANTHEHRFLSEVETVLNFNFEQQEMENRNDVIRFTCHKSGICHGVVFWFTLDFCQGTLLSTGPENTWNCWKQAMCSFEEPRMVSAGEVLKVKASSTVNRVSFSLVE